MCVSCVCVEHLNRCKTSTFLIAGGHSISLGLCPTKLPVKWDIQLGQLDVPAIFEFSVKWQPAKPTTGHSFSTSCTFAAICTMNLFYWFELQSISEFKAALRMGYFGSGAYSIFHTFILGIMMITSQRTL